MSDGSAQIFKWQICAILKVAAATKMAMIYIYPKLMAIQLLWCCSFRITTRNCPVFHQPPICDSSSRSTAPWRTTSVRPLGGAAWHGGSRRARSNAGLGHPTRTPGCQEIMELFFWYDLPLETFRNHGLVGIFHDFSTYLEHLGTTNTGCFADSDDFG